MVTKVAAVLYFIVTLYLFSVAHQDTILHTTMFSTAKDQSVWLHGIFFVLKIYLQILNHSLSLLLFHCNWSGLFSSCIISRCLLAQLPQQHSAHIRASATGWWEEFQLNSRTLVRGWCLLRFSHGSKTKLWDGPALNNSAFFSSCLQAAHFGATPLPLSDVGGNNTNNTKTRRRTWQWGDRAGLIFGLGILPLQVCFSAWIKLKISDTEVLYVYAWASNSKQWLVFLCFTQVRDSLSRLHIYLQAYRCDESAFSMRCLFL